MLFLVLLTSGAVLAAGLDDQGAADAKEATRLFHLGKYEEAAPIYAKLAVDYPDMVVFLRNLGACNYYLGKPEPALSSLRRYLKLREDIKPDDRATVERWIDEMEKLRAARLTPQEPTASAPPPEPTASAPPPDAGDALAPAPPLAAAAPPVEPAPHPAGLLTSVKPNDEKPRGRPFYKTWWFYAGLGAVAAAVVTTAILLSRGSDSACGGRGPDCLVVE